jgi:hypothetical protein
MDGDDIKLPICRLLVEHAKKDEATAAFLQRTLEIAMSEEGNNDDGWLILLETDMMHIVIQAGNIALCQLLVREYHIDPFLATTTTADGENDDDAFLLGDDGPVSPFQAAARLPDTGILEYFMDLWQERFASSNNGGKNGHGDYPLHLICCDAHVSLQAIKLAWSIAKPRPCRRSTFCLAFCHFNWRPSPERAWMSFSICYNIALMLLAMLELTPCLLHWALPPPPPRLTRSFWPQKPTTAHIKIKMV